MTGTIETLYIENTPPIYKLKAAVVTGSPLSNPYGRRHKTLFYIAVHKNHYKTFKTERGARNWLARWEKKP